MVRGSVMSKISEDSLNKILILGINDRGYLFFWSLKKENFIFDLQDQSFII